MRKLDLTPIEHNDAPVAEDDMFTEKELANSLEVSVSVIKKALQNEYLVPDIAQAKDKRIYSIRTINNLLMDY